VLIINSDIELRWTVGKLKRLRWIAENGLCYFSRFNHDGEHSRGTRECEGIDAFLFHGRDAALFARSFMSLGKPYWDYWVPHTFRQSQVARFSGRISGSVSLRHQNRWSWDEWHRCALEFERVIDERDGTRAFNACLARSRRIRQTFDQKRTFGAGGSTVNSRLGAADFRLRGTERHSSSWVLTVAQTRAGWPKSRRHHLRGRTRSTKSSTRAAECFYRAGAISDVNGQGLLILSKESSEGNGLIRRRSSSHSIICTAIR
jgi:hypothetical protein